MEKEVSAVKIRLVGPAVLMLPTVRSLVAPAKKVRISSYNTQYCHGALSLGTCCMFMLQTAAEM